MFAKKGVGVRSRPFLIAGLVALAVAGAGARGAAADDVRLAQRWTPLTGILSPDDPATGGNKEVREHPAPARTEPSRPATSVSDVATAKLSARIKLGSTTTDGQPHGSLGVRVLSIDSDLASGLGLGSERGALVSDVSGPGSGDLKVGDVIQKVDGRDVRGSDSLLEVLRGLNPDQTVSVEHWRAGRGVTDLKRLLTTQADAGNVGAAASLGRLLSLGLVFGARDYKEAAHYYLAAAKAGHLASMTRYALFAKDGIGIPKNESLAAKWFLEAAEGGQEAAMTNLGQLYEAGRGVAKDPGEAARWYRQAVDKGHVFAMHKLALMYETGRGVPKDDEEAVKLLRQASDKGLSEATSWLAEKYELGRGVAKDPDEAYRLNALVADQLRRSAEQGNAVATFNLGILYRIGKGVKKSDSEASYWVVRSLKLGDKYLVSELIRNPNVLSLGDRKWLQEVLRDEGTYKGPINGTFSPDVRTAMEALANAA